MKHTLLLFTLFFVPLLGYAQLEVKDDKQIMWGFVEFFSRFMLYGAGSICAISGLLYLYYSPRLKIFRKRKHGRRHHSKPRTATLKNRKFYLNMFLTSLGASIFLSVLVFVAGQNMK